MSSCEDSTRTEARTLYQQIDAIDISATPQQRKARIVVLKRLVLSDQHLNRVRRVCVEAHQALIDAELHQDQAKRALEAMEKKSAAEQTDGNPSSNTEMLSIAATIEKSNNNLKRAREVFPECEEEMRSLALRFPLLRKHR